MRLSLETLRLKYRNKIYIPLMRDHRKKKLHLQDFTIISNNCWAGTVYESVNMRKLSPTVGMFIMPEDYLRFIARLDYYLDQPLTFIQPDESKWKDVLKDNPEWGKWVIGKLQDVELQMLHYHDEEEARRKWEDRVRRVNRDCLIFKFNDQNGASAEHIRQFVELPLKNKLCFAADPRLCIGDCVVFIRHPRGNSGGVKASREPIGRKNEMDLIAYLNQLA